MENSDAAMKKLLLANNDGPVQEGFKIML